MTSNSNIVAFSHKAPQRKSWDAPAPLDETLPHSIEVEQAMLGALMLDNELAADLAAIVGPEHLFEPVHAHLYRVALDTIAAGHLATPITLKPYLGDFDLGGMTPSQYLARLAAEASTTVNAPRFARVLRDLAARREVYRIGTMMRERSTSEGIETPATSIIEEAEGALLEARAADPQTHLSGMSSAEGVAWLVDRIEKIRSGVMPAEYISTGLKDLDRVTGGGYGRGQLWVIAGRPGMGKTVVMTSLSRAAAREHGALGLQFEVTRDQQLARYVADLAYVHGNPLPFGKIMKAVDLDDSDLWRIKQAGERLSRMPLRIECLPGATLAQIAYMVRAEKKRLAKRGFRLGTVWIDYLKFIHASDRYKGQRFNEVGEITKGLKSLAKAEDCCIILLTQLNRGTEARDREDKRPNLADLGVSGDIEQDADVVAFLYREHYYLDRKVKARPNDHELAARALDKLNHLEFILGKNRAGPLHTVDMFADVGHSHVDAFQSVGGY